MGITLHLETGPTTGISKVHVHSHSTTYPSNRLRQSTQLLSDDHSMFRIVYIACDKGQRVFFGAKMASYGNSRSKNNQSLKLTTNFSCQTSTGTLFHTFQAVIVCYGGRLQAKRFGYCFMSLPQSPTVLGAFGYPRHSDMVIRLLYRFISRTAVYIKFCQSVTISLTVSVS